VKSTTNSESKITEGKSLSGRLQDCLLKPAAAVGAFSSFFADPGQAKSAAPEAKAASAPQLVQLQAPVPTRVFPIEYAQVLSIGDRKSARPFRNSLACIAIGPGDTIHALGDAALIILDSRGNLLRQWKAPDPASCLAVDRSGTVYLGQPGAVEIFSPEGTRKGGFAVGDSGNHGQVTAIKLFNSEILVADASAKYIRRYDASGKQLGEIGTKGKVRHFMLPNRCLDFDIDAKGSICAADSGRHQVSRWVLDGSPLGQFGKFGYGRPEDFVGCCNPVNIAFAPEGNIVTAEKVIARIKVFDGAGNLLALIGPEHFDPNCTRLHLAVDSKGRILVADPVRLTIKIFAAVRKNGDQERV
jgi:hypothetical protein